MLAALLLLAACAQPRAMLPEVTQSERQQELHHQRKLAHGAVRMDYKEVRFSKREKVAMQEHLQRVTDQLSPEATRLCRELNGPQADCDMHIELTTGDKALNAHADGEKIVINMAMVDFTHGQDEQLAFVLAHEYTHHMMGHVAAVRGNVIGGALIGIAVDIAAAAAGVNTDGQFSGLGAQAGLLSYSPAFEQEADYIALYMLARAGFNIERAPDFWRRMAKYAPEGLETRTTHPTTPERFVLMEKTIAEIKTKQQHGRRLLPNLQPET